MPNRRHNRLPAWFTRANRELDAASREQHPESEDPIPDPPSMGRWVPSENFPGREPPSLPVIVDRVLLALVAIGGTVALFLAL